MFDLAWSELLVIGVVALLVIKPKDLPKVLRTVGYWVRHARQVASEFQSSLEQMAREAELTDVKKEIEEAGRKLTADVQHTFDPVEIEKQFNPPAETAPTAEATAEAASTSPTPDPSIAAPAEPVATDEPTLPFLEPEPTPPPSAAPAPGERPLEPAVAKPPDHV
jgi:sec-independent protein translocase protein TatB